MIAYLEKFLALVERFVSAQERRNELLSASVTTLRTASDELAKQDGTTLAQDVATAEKNVSTTESASNGSASGAATGQTGRGRSRASAAGTATATTETPAETTQADAGAAVGNGRRQRTRASEATQTAEMTDKEEAGTESTAVATTGRRQRTRAASATETTSAPAQEQRKPEPEYDTPEQADDRAEIENLCQLAGDVDAANDEVKEYLAGKGWNVAVNIPSDDVETALDDINVIIDKYFQ